jgi:glycerol-3-phosphate O-acyltransferase
MVSFKAKLDNLLKEGKLTPKLVHILHHFHESYVEALKECRTSQHDLLFDQFLNLVIQQLEHPHHFEPYHLSIRQPFDYYAFGLNFIRPLILLEASRVIGMGQVDKMIAQLSKGENVILLANHQTEPDPQIISLLLEKRYARFVENMIFVAGNRVISDPLAVPFSMGCNLLCIFSKKHIEHPPELKESKLLHNQRTVKMMGQLLAEGGKCIYVAPSGGRDRPNAKGEVEVAPFDPSSLELFYLMGQQSGTPTHFYPLALATYKLLPPPDSVEKDIGEKRQTNCTPVHMAFGEELDMVAFPGSAGLDKRSKRKARADYIWNIVRNDYAKLMD